MAIPTKVAAFSAIVLLTPCVMLFASRPSPAAIEKALAAEASCKRPECVGESREKLFRSIDSFVLSAIDAGMAPDTIAASIEALRSPPGRFGASTQLVAVPCGSKTYYLGLFQGAQPWCTLRIYSTQKGQGRLIYASERDREPVDWSAVPFRRCYFKVLPREIWFFFLMGGVQSGMPQFTYAELKFDLTKDKMSLVEIQEHLPGASLHLFPGKNILQLTYCRQCNDSDYNAWQCEELVSISTNYVTGNWTKEVVQSQKVTSPRMENDRLLIRLE